MSKEKAATTENQARQMLASVKDYAIFMLDPEGKVKTWNAGAERIKGYSAHDIIGRHFSIFYPPQDVAAGKCDHELITAAAEGRYEDEGWRVRKDGSRFWANVVLSAIRDDGGQLLGFSKVTRDLSERRHAEEALRMSEERLRLLIRSVKDYAIFTLDAAGNVTTWNVSAQQMEGFTANEIIGRSFSSFYTAEDAADGRPAQELAIAAQEGRFEDENWRERKDGSKYWAHVVISPMREETSGLIGFATIMRDLTERRKAEQEQARLAQAQETIRLRDEFLSIASHELRTPLTSMRLELSALARRLADSDVRTAAKLTRLNRGTDRLIELVEALLDVSRISTGRLVLKPERVDLGKTVQDVIDNLRETARAADCPLTVQGTNAEIIGNWDRLRVEQVLTNLLANAIKYAANAPITVSIRRDDDNAVITVDDNGAGISPSDLDRIFGRFERASSPTHFGGLGLGLYVARQIVEAHRGTIRAANHAGRGASFVVTLPL